MESERQRKDSLITEHALVQEEQMLDKVMKCNKLIHTPKHIAVLTSGGAYHIALCDSCAVVRGVLYCENHSIVTWGFNWD